MKKIIKISLVLILIVGCTSCNKVDDLLYGSLPKVIEVPPIEMSDDIVFSEVNSTKIIVLNTKTEEVYNYDVPGIEEILTFKEGALVKIWASRYLTGVYRYFPEKGKLEKFDIEFGIRGWVKIDEDKIWLGSGERQTQTSKVAIYSISQNKIIEYRDIPYYVN